MIELTKQGLEIARSYINELKAKRKEILNVKKDTCLETEIPSVNDIASDIEAFDENGEYCNNWGITDNYNGDYPLCLIKGKHYLEK